MLEFLRQISRGGWYAIAIMLALYAIGFWRAFGDYLSNRRTDRLSQSIQVNRMGNHAVGNAMGKMAEVLVSRRLPGESAIDLLDKICKPYANTDAEFESEDPEDRSCVHPDFEKYTDPHPKATLGMLMLEAFAPNGVADRERYELMFDSDHPDSDAACDAWWDEVYGQLKKRYGFW